MLIELARYAPLVVALAAWRWSRLVALALALGSAVSLIYFIAPWEPLRWVSLVTGAAGATVLAWRAASRMRSARDIAMARAALAVQPLRGLEVWLECVERGAMRWAFGRPDALAALLVASSLVDLLALYRHRTGHPWGVQPVLQVAACLAMLAVSLWPRRPAPSP